MSTPTPPPTTVAPRRRTSALKMMFWLLLVPILLIVGYFAVVLNWNYSTGERAGWVQKLSRKGWLCKTWEGEMAMVSMPGAIPEKFLFTVRDDAVAESINKVMGKRVTLHYEEKVGLPTSCFGETRHFVTSVLQVEEIPLAPVSSCRTDLRLLQVRRLRLLRRSRPHRHHAVNRSAADRARHVPGKELDATVRDRRPFRCVYAVPAPTIISHGPTNPLLVSN